MKFPARERKNNEGSHNILKMISTTLKDVKRRRRSAKKQKKSLQSDDATISLCSEPDASFGDDSLAESRSDTESMEKIEQKSRELLNEILDALEICHFLKVSLNPSSEAGQFRNISLTTLT
mmetsp:Transcript_17020/g.22177  ORF Transcript_17020/g.22177 Transcript_17020/m.22177 type:complete len:121 (+) Transcript_17020:115-477(+)